MVHIKSYGPYWYLWRNVEKIHNKKVKGTDYLAYKNYSFNKKIYKLIFHGSPIYDGFDRFNNTKTEGIAQFYQSYLNKILLPKP